MKKAALVTGASSGIGAAIAKEYAQHGYFVFLMGRNKERLMQVALECPAGASVLSCDLLDEAAVKARLEEVLHHKIYITTALINCAGIFRQGTTEDVEIDFWREQFEVNVMAPVKLTKALIPYFKKHNSGAAIINISSTLGIRPTAGTGAYSASKAALNNWSHSLALELAPYKIRVNTICPGIVETPIHGLDKLSPEDRKNAVSKMDHLQPLGRVGQPQDIAKAAYFLGSDESSWTTGAVVSVDGGINL